MARSTLHQVRHENDEIVCTICSKRWSTGEDEPPECQSAADANFFFMSGVRDTLSTDANDRRFMVFQDTDGPMHVDIEATPHYETVSPRQVLDDIKSFITSTQQRAVNIPIVDPDSIQYDKEQRMISGTVAFVPHVTMQMPVELPLALSLKLEAAFDKARAGMLANPMRAVYRILLDELSK